MSTKKARSKGSDDLRPEYKLSELKNPVRGKYYSRAVAAATFVPLDPDVAQAFPTSKAVNDTLRMLMSLARSRVSNGTPKRPRR